MRRVYIGRLSHHVRERDIERFFRSEGKIREVLMKDGFAFVEFDHPDDAEAAVRRLNGRDLNGDRVHVEFAKGPPRGREGSRGMGMSRGPPRNGPIRRDFRNDRGNDRGRDRNDSGGRTGSSSGGGGISYAEKYGPPRNTDFRIIVENLSSRVSWQDLKDLMRQAGEVTFADAHKRERNMGIVDFASLKDMRHAIDTLNDTEFHGRRIKVYEDKGRRHGGGGSGGANRGARDSGNRRIDRSRSRSRSRNRYSSSRSRSREGTAESRSRSRSASSSPIPRREPQQRSRSRSRDGPESDRHQSRSRSRSRDGPESERHQSRSPSRSRSKSRSVTPTGSPPS